MRRPRLWQPACITILLSLSVSAWAQTAPPVTVVAAARLDVPIFATGIGTVQAYQSVLIRPRVDGTLDKISFAEGQDLKRGDEVAEIDPRPYQAVLAQVRAKRAADEAQLANLKLDQARYASLARTNFASRQQLDTQVAQVRQAEATLQGDDASIEAAALNVSFCTITSPIDGVAGLRQVDAGNLVHATDTGGIVTITQIKPISLIFTLPESSLPRLREAIARTAGGAPRVVAYASEGGRALGEGTLLAPSNSIDTTTGTIALKATFPNANRALWPGQFVAAHIQLGLAQNAVTVPASAVQHGPDGLFVYIVGADHTAKLQTVKTGYEGEGRVVVTEGLDGGEQVIVAGQVRVNAGSKVDPHPPGDG